MQTSRASPLSWLYPLFFASGFAALLYQIVWQRALFTLYGTNVESVTIVVTAFMAGLGAGSIFGGAVSKNPARNAAALFALAEVGIGLFGVISLQLFSAIAPRTVALPAFGMGAVVLFVLLVPTALMGATLPLLVAAAVRRSSDVGRSVGGLYFVNTLGSAAAAFAAATFLLHLLTMRQVTLLGAGLNFAIAALTFALMQRDRVTA